MNQLPAKFYRNVCSPKDIVLWSEVTSEITCVLEGRRQFFWVLGWGWDIFQNLIEVFFGGLVCFCRIEHGDFVKGVWKIFLTGIYFYIFFLGVPFCV